LIPKKTDRKARARKDTKRINCFLIFMKDYRPRVTLMV